LIPNVLVVLHSVTGEGSRRNPVPGTAAGVRWIATIEDLKELRELLLGVDEFAFDTEFHRERSYYPQLALLQVAWDGGIALIDPLAVDIASLGPAFTGRSTVVAHA